MHGAEPVWRLMRWFVDISLIGSGGKASRFCVEAEQWQRALQTVRERHTWQARAQTVAKMLTSIRQAASKEVQR